MKEKVNDELKQHFRPEFLNRIDEIIVFHQLTKDEIIEIVDLMIKRVEKQLKAKDMGIELTPAAKEAAGQRASTRCWAPRPLRRTIQREIEDPLSEGRRRRPARAGATAARRPAWPGPRR
jgi:ATP-dependent Clp protease ATP-binding subunit ClpC